MQLHCTKKLLERLDVSRVSLKEEAPANQIFSWQAHLVSIDRGKALIAVNEETFYILIMPQLKKKNFEKLAVEFYSALFVSLKSEGYTNRHCQYLFGGEMSYGKTYSRQLLGILNDAVKHIDFQVYRHGGWAGTNLVELTKEMNRTPWLASSRHAVYGFQKMKEVLGALPMVASKMKAAFI